MKQLCNYIAQLLFVLIYKSFAYWPKKLQNYPTVQKDKRKETPNGDPVCNTQGESATHGVSFQR